MRVLPAVLFLAGFSVGAAEKPEPNSYPLWDGKETVAEYAKRAGLEPTKALDLGNGVKLELVLIPAGKFLMGSPGTEKDRRKDEVQHEVTLTKPFYVGKYEVTQEQYQQVLGAEPSHVKGSNLPVECRSWNDAQEFCKKASRKTDLTVRLPTEAEWEYACRAGTKTAYHTGDAEADLNRAGWWGGNSRGETRPVGMKLPNPWGVYDKHGNVGEWCQDWYGPYETGPSVDPPGPAKGEDHVWRGGSAAECVSWCSRSAARHHRVFCSAVGFRLAASVPPKAP